MPLPLPRCLAGGYAPRVIAAGTVCRERNCTWAIERWHRAGRSLGNTCHRLLHVCAGTLRLRVAGSGDQIFVAGTVLYLPPGFRGELLLSSRRRLHSLIFIAGTTDRLFTPGGHPLAPSQPDEQGEHLWGRRLPLRLSPRDAAAASDVIVRVRNSYWRSPQHLLRCDAWLAEFLARFVGDMQHAPSDGAAAWVGHLIPKGLAMRVADMAKRQGCSERHLRRLFAAGMLPTPGRVLAEQRFESACRLLGRGVAIPEVATSSGYASASAFARAFRQHFGVTPSAWRRAMSDNA